MLINDIIDFILNLFRRKHRDVPEIELQDMLQNEEQSEEIEENIEEALEELAEQDLENEQDNEEEKSNDEVSQEQANGQVADEMENEEEQGKASDNIGDGQEGETGESKEEANEDREEQENSSGENATSEIEGSEQEQEGMSEGEGQQNSNGENASNETGSGEQGQETESSNGQRGENVQNEGQADSSASQGSQNAIDESTEKTGTYDGQGDSQDIDNAGGIDEGEIGSNEAGIDNEDVNAGGEEGQKVGTDANELENEEGQENRGSNVSDEQDGESKEKSIEDEEKRIAEEQERKEAEERAKEHSREMFGNIPKMEDMKSNSTGGGYSLDYGDLDVGEIPDSVISMLIEKFLNERFLKKDNDLNRRTNSSKITEGYYDWDLNALIRDKVTKNYNQMLRDKQGYKYSEGNAEKIPFSFYFDLSGSMSEYSRLLSIIAVKLIKKDVKIITGFNENAQLQIDKVPHKFDADDFKQVLFGNLSREQLTRKGIEYTIINQDIDQYLISKGAEKSVIFSDFDPDGNVVNLAKHCQVYWFCFEKRYRDLTCGSSLRDFKGRFYRTYDIKDFATHMKRITSRYHERQQRSMQLGE